MFRPSASLISGQMEVEGEQLVVEAVSMLFTKATGCVQWLDRHTASRKLKYAHVLQYFPHRPLWPTMLLFSVGLNLVGKLFLPPLAQYRRHAHSQGVKYFSFGCFALSLICCYMQRCNHSDRVVGGTWWRPHQNQSSIFVLSVTIRGKVMALSEECCICITIWEKLTMKMILSCGPALCSLVYKAMMRSHCICRVWIASLSEIKNSFISYVQSCF